MATLAVTARPQRRGESIVHPRRIASELDDGQELASSRRDARRHDLLFGGVIEASILLGKYEVHRRFNSVKGCS